MADSRWTPIIPQVRKLVLLACAVIAATLAVGTAGAATGAGTLSVEQGKGTVTVEIKGNVLGRLANGTVRVTDLTPRDRFYPLVLGRKLKITRPSPKTVVYKGQALRFQMLGGSTKLVIKGTGISVSAVGRGYAILDADRFYAEEIAGFYSLEGVDCRSEVALCVPLPDFPERHLIGTQRTITRGSSAR